MGFSKPTISTKNNITETFLLPLLDLLRQVILCNILLLCLLFFTLNTIRITSRTSCSFISTSIYLKPFFKLFYFRSLPLDSWLPNELLSIFFNWCLGFRGSPSTWSRQSWATNEKLLNDRHAEQQAVHMRIASSNMREIRFVTEWESKFVSQNLKAIILIANLSIELFHEWKS